MQADPVSKPNKEKNYNKEEKEETKVDEDQKEEEKTEKERERKEKREHKKEKKDNREKKDTEEKKWAFPVEDDSEEYFNQNQWKELNEKFSFDRNYIFITNMPSLETKHHNKKKKK